MAWFFWFVVFALLVWGSLSAKTNKVRTRYAIILAAVLFMTAGVYYADNIYNNPHLTSVSMKG